MDAKLEWEVDVEAVDMMDRGEETQGRDSQGYEGWSRIMLRPQASAAHDPGGSRPMNVRACGIPMLSV